MLATYMVRFELLDQVVVVLDFGDVKDSPQLIKFTLQSLLDSFIFSCD